MVFLLEITNTLAKVSRLLVWGFFIEIFKIRRLICIFLWIFVCFESMFCLSPRLWLDSWQSLETFAKIISLTFISILFLFILLHMYTVCASTSILFSPPFPYSLNSSFALSFSLSLLPLPVSSYLPLSLSLCLSISRLSVYLRMIGHGCKNSD
jgi:hypothetical protein